MQAYDLIMLIVIGMATIFGAIKGFAWQVASLASIVVSYVVAYRFRFEVADMIQAKPPWNQFLAMLILYVGTSFVIWVGFRLLSGTIDRVRLKEFDRHMGAAFGLAKGLVYCLLITMFATSLLGPNQQAAICQSRSGYYIAKALDRGVGILPKEIHDVVGPYLARLDNKLNQEGNVGDDPSASGDAGLWPGGLQNIPGIPQELQEGFRNSLPQLLPGAGGPNSDPQNLSVPGNWPPAGNSGFPSFPGAATGNTFPGTAGTPANTQPDNTYPSGYPQAQSMNPPAAPQVYPPLNTPAGNGYESGLRPSGYPAAQQAQLPNYSLPR